MKLPKTSAHAERAMESIGITKLEDLTNFTEKELLNLHGFGPKAMRILKEALKSANLTFKKAK